MKKLIVFSLITFTLFLLILSCGKSSQAPQISSVKINSASGPDQDSKYNMQVVGKDAVGNDVADTLDFRYLNGTTPVDAGPLTMNNQGSVVSYPLLNDTVNKVEVDLQFSVADGTSGNFTMTARTADDSSLLGNPDILWSGTGNLSTNEFYASVQMDDVPIDISTDNTYPSSGTMSFSYQLPRPVVYMDGTQWEITEMVIQFNGTSDAIVDFTYSAIQPKEKISDAIKAKLGNSAVGGILTNAKDQIFQTSVESTGCAKGARSDASQFATDLYLNEVGWFFLSNSWKGLKFVYTAGTGTAADVAEEVYDAVKDMVEEKLDEQSIETQSITKNDKTLTIVCNRTKGNGSLTITGKSTYRTGSGPMYSCFECDYTMVCTFKVDCDCQKNHGSMSCTAPVISKTTPITCPPFPPGVDAVQDIDF